MKELTLDQWIALRSGLRETLSQESLAAWQQSRLQEQAEYAVAHSRFWQRFYAGADLKKPETWPLLDQDALRRAGMEMLCLPQGEIQRISTLLSSGSSGLPKRLYFSAADLELTIDFFAHGMATMTQPGDRVWIAMNGSSADSLGDLLGRALARMGRIPLLHGEITDPEQASTALRQAQPHCLVGLSRQMLDLCRSTPELRPRTVLLSAENVPTGLRQEIQSIWQTEVYAHWGMRETGLGGAVECHAHQGYHIRHADLFLEIIDPETGKRLSPGHRGELVVSTLNRQAMPLLRYRSGDFAELLDGACPCGSHLIRLGYVEGHEK
ncbi:MAG: AMP-binding protein [Bacillota bacterium]|nr:AMP-binding protein [Bacillota bacterium]